MEEKFKEMIKHIFAYLSTTATQRKTIEYSVNLREKWEVGIIARNISDTRQRSYFLKIWYDFNKETVYLKSDLLSEKTHIVSTEIEKNTSVKVDISDSVILSAAISKYLERFIECVSKNLDAL